MDESLSERDRLRVNEALDAYGFSTEDAIFIRHNENLTFQVGERYLLRVHSPREGFTTDPIYDGVSLRAVRETELRLLCHLRAHGLNVQTPLPNRQGGDVTCLSDGTLATVLHWLPGRTVEKSDLEEPFCRALGRLLACLHRAAADFPPAPVLRYDAALCGRLEQKLARIEAAGALDAESVRDMSGALRVVATRLNDSERSFLPVHSDLSFSNLLITPDGPAPIDFSLFGYCHPMMDIGALFCALGGVQPRCWVLEGYRAEGGETDSALLDAGFVLNILLGVILHCESWTHEDWFAERLVRWRERDFRPLTDGASVLSL